MGAAIIIRAAVVGWITEFVDTMFSWLDKHGCLFVTGTMDTELDCNENVKLTANIWALRKYDFCADHQALSLNTYR